ncbi:glycosyltransferase family 32 protein [Chryseobacterium sp. MP_3.2]|uniref:glycosyltransferase family 32 protein n=1 Tax=Chryseobacterium sp. MP_3.2 TaxID=3071712 RepID=UPI002E0332BB|nr:mannosyltransferase OCH1-like enzyme [Chryseobacterium sp. MP_3.2]
MSIPKNIFQTFKTKKLPLITKWHIWRMKKMNPEYQYFLYDDIDIQDFFREEFGPEYLQAYNQLTIGAAKADFFRYAILYKKGGVYLDVDSGMSKPLRKLILPIDVALLSVERHVHFYCQWALIFDKGHPFLKKTLEQVLENIQQHKFPHDVHATTGPTAFTKAINDCLKRNPEIPHRIFDGIEYRGFLKFKYKLGKFFLYSKKSEHWKKKQMTQDIIKPLEE